MDREPKQGHGTSCHSAQESLCSQGQGWLDWTPLPEAVGGQVGGVLLSELVGSLLGHGQFMQVARATLHSYKAELAM